MSVAAIQVSGSVSTSLVVWHKCLKNNQDERFQPVLQKTSVAIVSLSSYFPLTVVFFPWLWNLEEGNGYGRTRLINQVLTISKITGGKPCV